jgi:DNA polymerase (family 10)
MYEAGAWVLLESAIADLPADLRWLFESGAVTLPQLAALHQTLDVTTASDLAAAVQRHAVRHVEGLDQQVEAGIAAALPRLRTSIPRISLGRAISIVEPLVERLCAMTGIACAMPVGSLRRGCDTIGDIEIVASATGPRAAIDAIDDLIRLPDVSRILHRGPRRLYVRLERVQLGLRFPDPSILGTALLQLTGSVAHLEELARDARARGVELLAPAATEEDAYARLDLPLIPAELRSGNDEILAAREGRLPTLLSASDIRGDLHMHSNWSDGRDPIETMVGACRALGYEYLAITDHSQRSAASRTLASDDVRRQADEIAGLRQRYPDIAILHGCEVDILADGRLDFPDEVLERFDIVLASLHDAAGQPPAQLQKRYEAAIRHPLVSVITHPTNRMPPYRVGYDLDYDRLFGLAAETGTALEIDGAPAHLDLTGALARRAIASGAMVAVDSDCHRAEMLRRQMRLGVMTARSGWVEPRHVLNTRPLDELRALLGRKRA